jgi:hypothetical protein
MGVFVGARGFFFERSKQLIAACGRRDPESFGLLARHRRLHESIASDPQGDLESFFAAWGQMKFDFWFEGLFWSS